MQLLLDPRETVCVARQPILDRSNRVFAYELLYRAVQDATTCNASRDLAAARVLTDTVQSLGLDTLTLGKPAFVNVSRNLLLSCAGLLLPPAGTVLELVEDIDVDDEVLAACKSLHALGYALALDDYVAGTSADKLIGLAKYVKIDVLDTPESERKTLAKELPKAGATLVAEKVETIDMAKAVRAEGFGLVQGFFFCRPATLSAKTVPARRLAYLELLAALNTPNVTVDRVEELVKRDASLSYRLLRSVNSAAFGIQREIRSIRQAIVMLGLERIRNWASVWAMAGINSGAPGELAVLTLLRARCCELLGQHGSGEHASEMFLLGLCSLLDVILDQPMDKVIESLPLSEPVRGALVGKDNPERRILDAVVAYERGSWSEADEALTARDTTKMTLAWVYQESLQWARELSTASAAAA